MGSMGLDLLCCSVHKNHSNEYKNKIHLPILKTHFAPNEEIEYSYFLHYSITSNAFQHCAALQ